ncbi:glycerol-3-phosphate acyltransferase [Anabaena sp. FACHB-1237]|uniref:glycerol-3-phosphate acyltransferase n=1 Tax=Anabaena sp. FACHB-1237 TaxID=2692769 RepID=UPI0016814B64|nr:glycerol-3-phosphate acyltransferase [Anabaena sp. FACHB-1237]MBD2137551.1 glycerol-3-phosphate acyltransferase [Anabaena sp. FACHB-1237]
MENIWGILVIVIVCPLLGALPLISWITYILSGKNLKDVGTGNISVSAAFYHGGQLIGTLSVISEALKGIAAVSLSQYLIPSQPALQIVALICLVLGRYITTKGAGITNVVWGILAYDPLVGALVTLFAVLGLIITRSKETIKLAVLAVFPVVVSILYSQEPARIIAATILSGLIAWIYQQIPDDLNLPVQTAASGTQPVMEYLAGESVIMSLNDELDPEIVGTKAANLSQIKRWGYSVPKGWVLPPHEDPRALIEYLQPSPLSPLVVRSSAIGEDTETASAAGQYQSILNVTNAEELREAIAQVRESYHHPVAVKYRNDRHVKEASMSVLIQQQVQSIYSGVAFSRDPISQQGEATIIEAMNGSATQVVSGKMTPEEYRVVVVGDKKLSCSEFTGNGKIPPALIKQVAYIARGLEKRYRGIPQDVEWSYDGQVFWVLQTRPITTLLPIWTRKIAAEVIPGIIHPLTWSINCPLTCGVWAEFFSLVLGEKTSSLNFGNMATLHYSQAYFNATLLGEIFLAMGLPPESLEFLTRGGSISKPPLNSTLSNLPGLTKLLKRELDLEKDFKWDYRQVFIPELTKLSNIVIEELSAEQLLTRVDIILELLKKGTYYSILAPLSAAIRQMILGISQEAIDHSVTPEMASLRSLQILALETKEILNTHNYEIEPENIFSHLAEIPEGRKIITEFNELIEDYGYLSQVGTDIAVPTWKEKPEMVQQLFIQIIQNNEIKSLNDVGEKRSMIQRRVDLKGRVTEVYSRLLAELRWTFLALENIWLKSGIFTQTNDIFFLEIEEIRDLVVQEHRLDFASREQLLDNILDKIEHRRSQYLQDSQIKVIPTIVYGNNPPSPVIPTINPSESVLRGIPASQGKIQGRVKILRNLQAATNIDKNTILVVPYTDSGWAPMLVQAGGIIAESGGKLSHGAIIAREYGIPAVMDIKDATYILEDGQQVTIDGSLGIVELAKLN